VTSKPRSTLDAAALCKMADRGQITGGLLDGPLAYDNAVSEEAAKTKEIISAVAGRADVIVVPDLEAGNMLAKQLALLDGAVLAALEALASLAPLHQPHNLAAIRILAKLHPGLPQVASFDTAFHHTMPALAQRFAIPRALHDEGIRRYGFHGLSYEYIARRLPELDPPLAEGRVILAHLGGGSSLCAMRTGCSVETTMSFTALDGLAMETRCGAFDPGAVLHLLRHGRMSVDEVEDLLYRRSDLLGVSGGIAGEMRSLLDSPDPRAAEAIDVYVYRIARELGALAAVLGGVDCLVFTAGIGEHSAEIRRGICATPAAALLGLSLEAGANQLAAEEASRRGPRSGWADGRGEDDRDPHAAGALGRGWSWIRIRRTSTLTPCSGPAVVGERFVGNDQVEGPTRTIPAFVRPNGSWSRTAGRFSSRHMIPIPPKSSSAVFFWSSERAA
jgi:acetate kinase